MDEIKEAIRDYILQAHLPGESRANLRDDTPLRSSGILDSLATLGLVGFVENRYGIEFDVYETTVERFDRIEDIADSIVRKRPH